MLKNKTIVIYGGAGLIGQEFVRSIKENNGKIIVVDKLNENDWRKLNINSDLYIKSDITVEKIFLIT